MSADIANLYMSDEEDQNSENPNQMQQIYGREAIIFLIDCRKKMFEKSVSNLVEDACSAFAFTLECCTQTLIDLIQSSQNTLLSVIFFGVIDKDEKNKKFCVFEEFMSPSVKKLKNVSEMTCITQEEFENLYEYTDEAYLEIALRGCHLSFTSCAKKLGLKRIFLFTNDDNPYPNNSVKQLHTRKRIEDLLQIKVQIYVIPIGSRFKPELFYQEVVDTCKNNNGDPVIPCEKVVDALDIIYREYYLQRSLAQIKFNISQNIFMSVRFLKFTCKRRSNPKVKLSSETNEQVQSRREFLNSSTGERLRPYEIYKTFTKGGSDITLSQGQLMKIRTKFSPCMELLGFKPSTYWQPEYHHAESFFVYPDENAVTGSRKLFYALLLRCKHKSVIPICSLVMRRGSRPKYVVLVPQIEEINKILPAGFHAFSLPYARIMYPNKNYLFESDYEKPFDYELEALMTLVKKMKIKNYEENYFTNPNLTKQYDNVLTIMESQNGFKLQRPLFEDTTIHYHNILADRIEDSVRRFKTVFSDNSSSRLKRGATSGLENKSKVLKKSEIVSLQAARKINSLTIPQLKEIMNNIPEIRVGSLKKDELVNLVYQHFDVIKSRLD